LRFATIYKHGGVYLDLDCFVTKKLSLLRNVVGFESKETLGSAVIIMDKGHAFLADALEETLHRSVECGPYGRIEAPLIINPSFREELSTSEHLKREELKNNKTRYS
jgi:mannosyltransferase OCH1-like enzyme